MLILIILAYVLIPVLLIVLAQNIRLLDKIGVVVLAFLAGISFSAVLDLPALIGSDALAAVQKNFSELSIALALPLLVFSVDVKASLKLAGPTMKSMGLALLSVCIMSAIGAILFSDKLDNIWQTAGMAVGAYTGGGPNIAAIKTAIEADQATFNDIFTYDLLLSTLFLLFVMTLGKPIFKFFLPAFDTQNKIDASHAQAYAHMSDESAASYTRLVVFKDLPKTLLALLFSVLAVGLAVGLAQLLPKNMQSAGSIILITTLGVAFSFIPFVRAIKNSFQLGMFLILVFCFSAGSMADTSIFTNLNVDLFLYIGLILIGSLILQAILCRIFKIDVDTFLITSTAAIMSVPFIPVVASAIKNKEVLIPGFAVAILGYMIGNYLGIAMAYATQWLLLH